MAIHRRLRDILYTSVLGIRSGDAVLRRELLHSLRMEQRGRRLKEQRDFSNLSMPEAKAPLRDSIQALLPSISVNHRLIQIALPCCKSDGTLACLKSFVPKSVFDMAKRLCSSASPNMCQSNWKSARPESESPKVGTVSEFSTDNSIDRRYGLTENKSCPSYPDFSRAEHDINEGRAKTSAAWVAATAAPHHATGNRDLLSGFTMEHDDLFVHASDGVPRKVLARGSVITDAVILPDVWFVPGLTGNLVSVSQLAELDHSIGFGRSECCIRNARDGKIVGKGRLQKGVYVLDFLKIPLAI